MAFARNAAGQSAFLEAAAGFISETESAARYRSLGDDRVLSSRPIKYSQRCDATASDPWDPGIYIYDIILMNQRDVAAIAAPILFVSLRSAFARYVCMSATCNEEQTWERWMEVAAVHGRRVYHSASFM